MAPNHDVRTFGKRLLPHIVDERARTGYERPFALYPHSKVPGQGFKSVSYAQVANAVNRAAWWLDLSIPKNGEREFPVAYLGPNDLRYIVFVLATMKTGRKVERESPWLICCIDADVFPDSLSFAQKHRRCPAISVREA